MTIYKEFKSPKKEFKIFNRAKRALSLSPKTKYFEKIAIVSPNKEQQKLYICTYIDPKTNKRCKRHLNMYPEFCEKHTMLIQNVFVKKSNISNAGNGLFAGEYGFKTDDIIGEYSMPFIKLSWDELENRSSNPNTSYLYCENPKRDNSMECWDALDYRSSIMRYANDAHGSKFHNNAVFDMFRRKRNKTSKPENRIYLVASRDISPFHEIFLSYSPDNSYWN